MSIYHNLRNKTNWNKPIIREHQDISPNERFMLHCASKYYHAFWSEDGLKLTSDMNNPNFTEIVDNCKNTLPYDHERDRTNTSSSLL